MAEREEGGKKVGVKIRRGNMREEGRVNYEGAVGEMRRRRRKRKEVKGKEERRIPKFA